MNTLPDLLTALINGIGGSAAPVHGGTIGTQLQTNAVLTPGATQFLSSQTVASGKPKAFLNWVLFDEKFKLVSTSSSVDPVGDDEVFKLHVVDGILMNKSGYLYVYVSNETPNINVFFDNLQVSHVRSPLVEETHYYPFGLTMSGISSKAVGGIENKYQYSGKEIQNKEFSDGGGLDIYDFGARNYDAQIGRWNTIDPLAEKFFEMSPYNYTANNPIINIDPNGEEYILWYHDHENKRTSINLKSWDDVEKLKDINSKNDFVKNMYKVFNYSKGEEIAEKALTGDFKTEIEYKEGFVGEYDDKNNILTFDPLVGIEHINDDQMGKDMSERKGNGKATSPAAMFLHEVGHFINFMEDPKGATFRQYNPTSQIKLFGTKEEKRVIQLVENPFARKKIANGESPRTNHGGLDSNFESPTSTKIIGLTKPLAQQIKVQKAIKDARKGGQP